MRLVCQQKKLHVFTVMKMVNVTISGNTAQDHAALVQRFIMTGVKNMDVASQTVRLDVTVTGLWKYGIMCLHNLTVMAMAIIQNLKTKI